MTKKLFQRYLIINDVFIKNLMFITNVLLELIVECRCCCDVVYCFKIMLTMDFVFIPSRLK